MGDSAITEAECLERLRRGDVDAYMRLYAQYGTHVYGWVLRFVKVPAYAEDIVQDVFLKIWEVRERIDPAQYFPVYLYKISRNKTFTFLKKNASDEDTRLQIMQRIGEITESPYHRTLWAQYQQMLDKAVTQLPTSGKECSPYAGRKARATMKPQSRLRFHLCGMPTGIETEGPGEPGGPAGKREMLLDTVTGTGAAATPPPCKNRQWRVFARAGRHRVPAGFQSGGILTRNYEKPGGASI